jgi:hypothetical protein
MKRIVLSGGSGFLGRALAAHFQKAGYEIVVLTRAPKPGQVGIRQIAWDACTRGDWAMELEGATAVINLAGRSVNCRYHERNRRQITQSRVLSTQIIGEVISNCKMPLPVWLNASTATIYKHTYHHGDITYNHDWRNGVIRGKVGKGGNELVYHAALRQPVSFQPCEAGSLEEWLMERYTAFNSAGGRKRFFRVWHPPWPNCAVEAAIHEYSLLTRIWPWFSRMSLVGANFSPGLADVWMGRPHSITS